MISATFDTVKLDNLKIEIDFDWGSSNLEGRDEIGLVECTFAIEGVQYEYSEYFDTHTGKLEQCDKMHPSCSSDLAAAFDDYLNKLMSSESRGYDCLNKLQDFIETKIALEKPTTDMILVADLLAGSEIIKTVSNFIADITNTSPEDHAYVAKSLIDIESDSCLDAYHGLSLQVKCGFEQDIANEIIDFVKFEVDRVAQCERFDSELRRLSISQNEFCRRNGITAQGVVKWRKNGKFPLWTWNALRGMTER